MHRSTLKPVWSRPVGKVQLTSACSSDFLTAERVLTGIDGVSCTMSIQACPCGPLLAKQRTETEVIPPGIVTVSDL